MAVINPLIDLDVLPLPRKQSPSQYISIFLVSETYLPMETTLLCHLAAEFFFSLLNGVVFAESY